MKKTNVPFFQFLAQAIIDFIVFIKQMDEDIVIISYDLRWFSSMVSGDTAHQDTSPSHNHRAKLDVHLWLFVELFVNDWTNKVMFSFFKWKTTNSLDS